jgi:rubredoxin
MHSHVWTTEALHVISPDQRCPFPAVRSAAAAETCRFPTAGIAMPSSTPAFASALTLRAPATRGAHGLSDRRSRGAVAARARTRHVARMVAGGGEEGGDAVQEQEQAQEQEQEQEQAQEQAEALEYWPGELVCTDCGFVYNNAKRKKKFEDLPDTWVCPQCNASKRRFARKVGDFVEKTAGTDNTPIYAFSIAGLLAMFAFFFWASQNL